MNQQEYKEVACASIFADGIPRYAFKATRRIGYCTRCGCKLGKEDVRLRVMSVNNRLLLCTHGICIEWFFKELLKRKGDVD